MFQTAKIVNGVAGIVGATVPFAGGVAVLLNQVVGACDEVVVHKKTAKAIRNKCVALQNTLAENQHNLQGSEMQKHADELLGILTQVNTRVQRSAQAGRVWSFVRSGDIGDDLEWCKNQLETALSDFQIKAQIAMVGMGMNSQATMNAHHAEVLERLHRILDNQNDQQVIAKIQETGSFTAETLMEAGQLGLRQLRETGVGMQGNASTKDASRYVQYQRDLSQLQRITGVPPSVKILDGEITKEGEVPLHGGTYSEIWRGKWLNERPVALKALRIIKARDEKAQQRFLQEITIWAGLRHPNILQLFGIVRDMGVHLCTVAPWQENGNVLEYTKSHVNVDRVHLMVEAADGLRYLHSRKIIHGNVKCANILVSANGQACICDFGMAKIIEDITQKNASATLTESGSARWLAPELIEGLVSSPSLATDVYSFAMALLELITGARPYAKQKHDAQVIREVVIERNLPPRPTEYLNENHWELMVACWDADFKKRPSMREVHSRLAGIDGDEVTS